MDNKLPQLNKLIRQALESGRTIAEVCAPLSDVKLETSGELSLARSTNEIVGTLFGFPYRDIKQVYVVTG
jgi:hypothetical protein